MSIILKNNVSGFIKKVPTGFSFTTMMFGFIPAFIRGDLKWGMIQLIFNMITCGLSNLVFMFIYNGLYLKDMLSSGFVPYNNRTKERLEDMGIILAI